jgi:hypothetical protein
MIHTNTHLYIYSSTIINGLLCPEMTTYISCVVTWSKFLIFLQRNNCLWNQWKQTFHFSVIVSVAHTFLLFSAGTVTKAALYSERCVTCMEHACDCAVSGCANSVMRSSYKPLKVQTQVLTQFQGSVFQNIRVYISTVPRFPFHKLTEEFP